MGGTFRIEMDASKGAPQQDVLLLFSSFLSLALGHPDPYLVSLNRSPVSLTLERHLERQTEIAGRRLKHLKRHLERRSVFTAATKPKRVPEGTRFIESYLKRDFLFMLALKAILLVFLECQLSRPRHIVQRFLRLG